MALPSATGSPAASETTVTGESAGRWFRRDLAALTIAFVLGPTAVRGFWVAAGSRRRGIGTALVAVAEAEARRRGRTVVMADATSVPGEESVGLAFAAKVGYDEANLEEHKVLDLAASEAGWAALEAEAAAALGDYRIEVWTEIPDEHMAGYCHLLNVFISQIPLGDLELDELKWDAARIRASEQRSR